MQARFIVPPSPQSLAKLRRRIAFLELDYNLGSTKRHFTELAEQFDRASKAADTMQQCAKLLEPRR